MTNIIKITKNVFKFFQSKDVKAVVMACNTTSANTYEELKDKYDFIFMDAAKGQYINFLPEIKRLMPDNGMLLTDNVLQDGDVIESRFIVERRNRTIHSRMREYLYALTHDKELTTVILQLGDGAAVSIKAV